MFGAIVVWAFLYESAGLSLENVDIMYKDPAVKPWTSSRWAPPGYASRADAVEERRERPPTAMDTEKVVGPKGTALASEEERAEHV